VLLAGRVPTSIRILDRVTGHHANVIEALSDLAFVQDEIRRFAAAREEAVAIVEGYPPRSPASDCGRR
jgi:hypothetical protein